MEIYLYHKYLAGVVTLGLLMLSSILSANFFKTSSYSLLSKDWIGF